MTGIYAKDKIYFTLIPRKTSDGIAWFQWVKEILSSYDGKEYFVLKREKYDRHLR